MAAEQEAAAPVVRIVGASAPMPALEPVAAILSTRQSTSSTASAASVVPSSATTEAAAVPSDGSATSCLIAVKTEDQQ